jgi:uncharacterized membrane protein
MTNSKNITALIGPTIIALTKCEAMNLHIWTKNIAPVTCLNGTLLFVAILSIIRVHNRWTGSWPDTSTFAGWITIPRVQLRMFAPEAPRGDQNTFTYVFIIVLFAIGMFLTFKDYRQHKN